MKREIKRVWNLFDKRSKDLAVYVLCRVFDNKKTSVKQHWIYSDNIPTEYQKQVLEIFVKIFKRQVRLLNNIEVVVG